MNYYFNTKFRKWKISAIAINRTVEEWEKFGYESAAEILKELHNEAKSNRTSFLSERDERILRIARGATEYTKKVLHDIPFERGVMFSRKPVLKALHKPAKTGTYVMCPCCEHRIKLEVSLQASEA